MMRQREETIKVWFDMWLGDDISPLDAIFSEDVFYSECWGLEYKGLNEIRCWFEDWHKHNEMVVWEIKEFIHESDKTIALWHMEAEAKNGNLRRLEGAYIVEWQGDKIQSLLEYGANCRKRRPYRGC